MHISSFTLAVTALCLLHSCKISLCRSVKKPLNKTIPVPVELNRQNRQKRFTDGIFGINTNPYFGDSARYPTTSGLGSPLGRSDVVVPDIDDLRNTGSSIRYSFPGGNSANEYQFPMRSTIHGSQYPSFPVPASPYHYRGHRIPGSSRQLHPFRHSSLGSGVKSAHKEIHCSERCDEFNVCQSCCDHEHSDFETEEFKLLMNAIPACGQADGKRRDLLEKDGSTNRTKRNAITAAYLNSKGYCCDRRISKNWEGAKSAGGVIRKIKRRHAGNS